MDWQKFVADILREAIPDKEIARSVIAELDTRTVRVRAADELTFEAVAEPAPGRRLRALFDERWPAYRRWYLRDGWDARPSLDEGRKALERHMPELVPVHAAIVDAVGADELGARMLTLFDPPPILSGCSQVALADPPTLVRNYDYDADLFDGVVLDTRWLGRRVIGMSDQLWGLLDGINDAGLAVSFTFGGRKELGRGFSVPLVVRYLLETCTTVAEAVAALRRIPVQAAYNVTVIDRDGDHATVWLVPDRPAEVTRRRATTNHQARVDWPQHARWTRSEERLDLLEAVLADPERLIASMTRSPLRSTNVSEGFATLYTAVYRPAEGSVEYRWPDSAWRHSFERFEEGTHEVTIGADRPLTECR